MQDLLFFDLLFRDSQVRVAKDQRTGDDDMRTVEDEFYKFFRRNNLLPLFTNEHRTAPIQVALIDAYSVLKEGGVANKILRNFARVLNMGMDNKMYESAVFKILYESTDWKTFLIKLQEATDYINTILPNYLHNTWNIVFYDKDKSGTKASGVT